MLLRMRKIRMPIVLVILALQMSCATTETQQPAPAGLSLGKPDTSDVDGYLKNAWSGDTFARTDYVDNKKMPPVTREQKKKGYVVFSRNWMDLIFPNSIPKANEITGELKIFASTGEYEPASFCIRTLKELKGLHVSATELVSKNGKRINPPELSIVRCVPRAWQSEEWLYKDGPVGVMNMPTYLEKLRLLDIAAGRTVQFWATVKVEDNAAPGIYHGKIRLSDEHGTAYSIKIKVNVLGIDLIEPPQTLGFWDFQRAYKDEIGTLDQVYQVMSEHGMNAVCALRAGVYEYDKETDTTDFSKYISIDNSGKVTVDLNGSSLERSMEAANKAGFRYVICDSVLQEFVSEQIKARYPKTMRKRILVLVLMQAQVLTIAGAYFELRMQELMSVRRMIANARTLGESSTIIHTFPKGKDHTCVRGTPAPLVTPLVLSTFPDFTISG